VTGVQTCALPISGLSAASKLARAFCRWIFAAAELPDRTKMSPSCAS